MIYYPHALWPGQRILIRLESYRRRCDEVREYCEREIEKINRFQVAEEDRIMNMSLLGAPDVYNQIKELQIDLCDGIDDLERQRRKRIASQLNYYQTDVAKIEREWEEALYP